MEPAQTLAYVRGRLIPSSEAALPLHDAGLVWGATVTDLCRTIRHRLYRWPDHLARFSRGCRAVGIDLPLNADEVTRQGEALVRNNVALLRQTEDLALVLLATPGPLDHYAGRPSGPGEAGPTLVMHTFPLPLGRYRSMVERGAQLMIPSVRHVPPACVDRRIKQRSRLHWWLAEQEAAAAGALALLLDGKGYITETAGANFLAVRDGTVISPPGHCVLEGVSLAVVKELCASLDIPFLERPLTPEECLGAQECLLTSTPYGVVGVSSINGVPVPWPGPVLRRLVSAWNEVIGVDLHGQILASQSVTATG